MSEHKVTNLGNNPKGLYHQWLTDIYRLLGAKGKVYFGSLGFNSQDWCGNLPAGTNSPPHPPYKTRATRINEQTRNRFVHVEILPYKHSFLQQSV